MAEVLFYERPVPLNRTTHKDLRMQSINDVSFAAKVHSVPLTAAEFPSAARDFPILFAGKDMADAGPMALLGLRQFENLFVDVADDNGQWAEGAYVPAFVRRYPFVLAEKPPEAEGDDFTVYLDEAYAGFGDKEGERLFNEDGTDTEVLKNAVQFLSQFQEQVKLSKAFTERLRELELLEPRTVQLQNGEQTTTLNGMFVVSEEKLRKLDEKTAHELLVDGTLGLIFAHLLSLANIDRLRLRLNQRTQEPEAGDSDNGSNGSNSAEAKEPAQGNSQKAD